MMKKPQYIVDDEGKRVSVILSVEEYESLLEELDDSYCDRLLQKAVEANEPNLSLENYLKERNKLSANEAKETAINSRSTQHPDLAKALYEIYKNLSRDVQIQFSNFLLKDIAVQHDTDFAALSEESFAEIWNAPENEHWDQFLKERLNV